MPRRWWWSGADTSCGFIVDWWSWQPSCTWSLRVCDPYSPNQKGGVERIIRYMKGRFFAARLIHSLAQGNAQLLEFN